MPLSSRTERARTRPGQRPAAGVLLRVSADNGAGSGTPPAFTRSRPWQQRPQIGPAHPSAPRGEVQQARPCRRLAERVAQNQVDRPDTGLPKSRTTGFEFRTSPGARLAHLRHLTPDTARRTSMQRQPPINRDPVQVQRGRCPRRWVWPSAAPPRQARICVTALNTSATSTPRNMATERHRRSSRSVRIPAEGC